MNTQKKKPAVAKPTNLENQVEVARARVHAAKSALKQARKNLKKAKHAAKKARKALGGKSAK